MSTSYWSCSPSWNWPVTRRILFSRTPWTQREGSSKPQLPSVHYISHNPLRRQLHCVYVGDQLSSCIAAVSARLPAALDRSRSEQLGSARCCGSLRPPPPPPPQPRSSGDGGFSDDHKNVTIFVCVFAPSRGGLGAVPSRFFCYYCARHLESECRTHLDRSQGGNRPGFTRRFLLFFFNPLEWTNNMSRRKQTNPFKVDCRYSRYCFTVIVSVAI